MILLTKPHSIGWLALLVALALGGAGCRSVWSQKGAEPARQAGKPALSGVIEDGMRVIRVSARRYEFVPCRIVVNQGDKVRLDIAGADVTHGFALSEYGLKQVVDAGKIVSLSFTADRSGVFSFRCPIFCGWKWLGMRGRLVVLPAGK